MISEITLIAGALGGALASGLAGLLVNELSLKRSRARLKVARDEMKWEHQSSTLARNLLVLETISDEIEATPLGVAVRARLTPAEMQQAADELSTAGLVDQPSPSLLRITEAGLDVLSTHKLELEESALQREQGDRQVTSGNLEDLDHEIDHAVAALRTRHAH